MPTPLAPLSRLLRPFAPAWVQDAWPQAAQSRLTHCLLLALLLHVWLVLMLGNAPPGTAPPGQGVWGALNVTLRGPPQDGQVAVATPPTPPAGMPGTAASPRAGGTVRTPGPRPLPEPGAARQGDWAQTPAPGAEVVAPAESPSEPIRPAPPAAVLAPPPEPLTTPGPPAPPAERRLGATLSPPNTAARAAPLERAVPAAPAVARLPLPTSLPEAAVLAPLPAVPSPPTAPTPAAALPAAVTSATSVAAPAADPVPAAPVLRQVAPMATPATAPALSPVQAQPAQTPLGMPTLPAGPTGQAMMALPSGRPDAGPQVGHDVATAPSAPASAPRLNLELARQRGGELSRQGGAGVLPLLPRPPELPDKLARDIDKSAKADCRKAYQGLGLLAVVPLAADAVRGGKDGGCKW